MSTATTTFDMQKVVEFLRQKWGVSPACPMCRISNWSVNESVFVMPEFKSGGTVLGGVVFPVVPVTCNNCGNSVFVNAIKAGVMPPSGGQ